MAELCSSAERTSGYTVLHWCSPSEIQQSWPENLCISGHQCCLNDIIFRWHMDTMPPECLIACGWWLNSRHKRGRRNVNQAADAWNQYFTLITCQEWPLRDTHVLSVESAADSEDTQILLPTSRTAHGPDLPPPTTHSHDIACHQGNSSDSVGTSDHVHAWREEMCVECCASLQHANLWISKRCEVKVRGDEVMVRELNHWNQHATVFKDNFQEITKANLARPWSQNNNNTLPFMLTSIWEVGLHPATGLKPHPCFLGLCFTFLSGELN